MYIQHFDPMSSYPALSFYITVDNCNYQLIIRGIKSLHEFIYTCTRFLITALLSGTWYSTNMCQFGPLVFILYCFSLIVHRHFNTSHIHIFSLDVCIMLLTKICISRLRKRKGLEDMELH